MGTKKEIKPKNTRKKVEKKSPSLTLEQYLKVEKVTEDGIDMNLVLSFNVPVAKGELTDIFKSKLRGSDGNYTISKLTGSGSEFSAKLLWRPSLKVWQGIQRTFDGLSKNLKKCFDFIDDTVDNDLGDLLGEELKLIHNRHFAVISTVDVKSGV